MTSFTARMRRHALLWILLCALVVRLAFIFATKSYQDPGTWEFGRIATYLMEGKGYALWRWNGSRYTQAYSPQAEPLPSAYMPPLYPLLLAGCYRLLGKTNAAYLLLQGLQAALGALTCWLVFLLAKELGSSRLGLWAAGASALYPPLIYMASTMHPINFYVPAYLIVILLVIVLICSCIPMINLSFALSNAILVLFRA
jgi:4-amino-4-deoxy-L-arabinose transferase-like glycosyltransferase